MLVVGLLLSVSSKLLVLILFNTSVRDISVSVFVVMIKISVEGVSSIIVGDVNFSTI